jgi:hypothetical protein
MVLDYRFQYNDCVVELFVQLKHFKLLNCKGIKKLALPVITREKISLTTVEEDGY